MENHANATYLHVFPNNGNGVGPGTSLYGLTCSHTLPTLVIRFELEIVNGMVAPLSAAPTTAWA